MKLLRPAALLAALALTSSAFAEEAPADIWKAKCKGCHGATGNADTKIGKKEKIPDFTRPQFQQKTPDSELRDVITNGSTDNPKMKPFKDKLTPEQIDGLVKYIRTLGKHR